MGKDFYKDGKSILKKAFLIMKGILIF